EATLGVCRRQGVRRAARDGLPGLEHACRTGPGVEHDRGQAREGVGHCTSDRGTAPSFVTAKAYSTTSPSYPCAPSDSVAVLSSVTRAQFWFTSSTSVARSVLKSATK